MRSLLRKIIAVTTTVTMSFSLLSGMGAVKSVTAATGDEVSLTPWIFYQTGTSTDTWNNWELCAFSSVTFGKSGVTPLTADDFAHESVSTSSNDDEKTVVSDGVSTSFTAVIESNGWSADYDNGLSNPYALSAYMEGIAVQADTTYAVTFDAKALVGSASQAAVKHLQISVENEEGTQLVAKTYKLEEDDKTCGINFAVEKAQDVTVKISLGAFVFEEDKESNFSGSVYVKNMSIAEGTFEDDQEEQGDAGEVSKTTQFPAGYTARDLVWSDEFSSDNLNEGTWNYETGNGNWGWGNAESQYYTARKSNVYIADVTDTVNGSVDNKALAIKAKKDSSMAGFDYTSGRIQTNNKVSFKYGYIEAKIKMDNGMAQGVWPAFWMLGKGNGGVWPGCGEYDIMEHANANNYITGTFHWDNNGQQADYGSSKSFSNGDINSWHKYGMEWDRNGITIYLDGVQVVSMGYSDGASELFSDEAYMILNVAIGGNFIGNVLPAGSWTDSTMYVDYVRVFQKENNEGSSFSGTWNKDPFWQNYDYDNDQSSGDTDPPVKKEPVNGVNGWTHVHDSYEAGDADIANTTVTDLNTGFSASISMTGWQGLWGAPGDFPGAVEQGGYYGDLPYQLNSYTTVDVEPGKTYKFGFDAVNRMRNTDGEVTEKNVTITINSGVEGDYDNTFLFDTVTIPANSDYTYVNEFTVPEQYALGTVKVQVAYGCYAYSYNAELNGATNAVKDNPYLLAPGTTEAINARGKLTLKNVYCVTEGTEIIKEVEADTTDAVTNWVHTHKAYESSDAAIENTTVDDDNTGFTANISITGWQGLWSAPEDYPAAVEQGGYYGDSPYQLRSEAVVDVEPGKTYTLSFDIINRMYSAGGTKTEKNVTVTVNSGIEGDTDNTFVFKTVTVPKDGTYSFSEDIVIPEGYSSDTISIQLAYGCYAYSYNANAFGNSEIYADNPYMLAPGTTEAVNATGKLTFDKIYFRSKVTEPDIEINGFQINAQYKGFRTVYSVSDPDSQAVSVGLVYGLADKADESDMAVGSSNGVVYSFDATEKGRLANTYGSFDDGTSYAMTMKFAPCSSAFFTANVMVRAYCRLANGEYVYSDVRHMTVFAIADQVYKTSGMATKAAHDYLYDSILHVVDRDYARVEYNPDGTISK